MVNPVKKILVLTILAGIATLCAATSAPAAPTWLDGTVTSSPEPGPVRHLGVNDTDYSLMKNTRLTRRYKVRKGAFSDDDISFSDIRIGDKVEILRQGFRIYEIVVVESR